MLCICLSSYLVAPLMPKECLKYYIMCSLLTLLTLSLLFYLIYSWNLTVGCHCLVPWGIPLPSRGIVIVFVCSLYYGGNIKLRRVRTCLKSEKKNDFLINKLLWSCVLIYNIVGKNRSTQSKTTVRSKGGVSPKVERGSLYLFATVFTIFVLSRINRNARPNNNQLTSYYERQLLTKNTYNTQ